MNRPNDYSPFMPFGMNPYQVPSPQPPKTPQQIEAETKAMNDQYRNAYGMMANMGQVVPQAQENSYVRIQSYSEVRQAQAPSDGRPLVFICEQEGMLYSKKMDKGVEYVKAFRLVPEDIPKETTGCNDEMMTMLQNITERLDRLEKGRNDERKYTDGNTKK